MEDFKVEIAEIKTHILYIREKIDNLASKTELLIHRWIIGGLAFAIMGIVGWMIKGE